MKIITKENSKSLHRDKLLLKGFTREVVDDLLGLKVMGFRVSKQKLFLMFMFVFCLVGVLIFYFKGNSFF